jgi:hypothetical protein
MVLHGVKIYLVEYLSQPLYKTSLLRKWRMLQRPDAGFTMSRTKIPGGLFRLLTASEKKPNRGRRPYSDGRILVSGG